jgi:hypothetical protein
MLLCGSNSDREERMKLYMQVWADIEKELANEIFGSSNPEDVIVEALASGENISVQELNFSLENSKEDE